MLTFRSANAEDPLLGPHEDVVVAGLLLVVAEEPQLAAEGQDALGPAPLAALTAFVDLVQLGLLENQLVQVGQSSPSIRAPDSSSATKYFLVWWPQKSKKPSRRRALVFA
jgi:hypothetical protein